jgi:hypothetical protein
MKRNRNIPKPLVAGVVAAELTSAVLAWRDLAHRRDDQVRGTKTGWRVFITLNPGNSLAYWALARR